MIVANSIYNYTPINTSNNNLCFSKKSNAQSFGNSKWKSKLKAKGMRFLTANIILSALELVSYPNMVNCHNEKDISKNVGWDKNVKVLASNGQNIYGITSFNSSYTTILADKLTKNGVNTLEKANKEVIKSGHNSMPYLVRAASAYFPVLFRNFNTDRVPLETIGRQLNIFDKSKKDKERFILSFYMSSLTDNFSSVSESFTETVKSEYNISDKNIIRMPIESLKDFEQGLDSIMNKINKFKNKDNAELLIVYNGHGDAEESVEGAKKIEGAMDGILGTYSEIKEKQIKALFHQKLNGTKTLFIIDACRSGAWISTNVKKSLKVLV